MNPPDSPGSPAESETPRGTQSPAQIDPTPSESISTQSTTEVPQEFTVCEAILACEKDLKHWHDVLVKIRLASLLKYKNRAQFFEESKQSPCISNVEFKTGPDGEWALSYAHATEQFCVNDYANSEESDDEDARVAPRTTKVTLGWSADGGYHFKGSGKINLKIYTHNASGSLRVINAHYRMELSIDEQTNLMRRYAKNKNVPEWLGISTLLTLQEYKWGNLDLVRYLTQPQQTPRGSPVGSA
jgi:hypothetical protein